jgi:hypothetical protein
MRRLAKHTLILLGFIFLGMQFVSVAAMPKNSAPIGAPMAEVVNPQVGAILDRSCQDCHSNRTNWPWYSHVAPVSWIVSKHVSDGREMLDFSEWTDQPRAEGERSLICDAVSSGSMPLASYTMIHRKARLSKHDVKLICDWAAATGKPSK